MAVGSPVGGSTEINRPQPPELLAVGAGETPAAGGTTRTVAVQTATPAKRTRCPCRGFTPSSFVSCPSHSGIT